LLLGAGLRMLPGTARPAMDIHITGFWIAYTFSFTAYSLAVFAV